MSQYRRSLIPGATYFFTVTLADRQSNTLLENIDLLRSSYQRVTQAYPFTTLAIAIMPDHLHAVWQLPPNDSDYSKRWSVIKAGFSKHLPANELRSQSKINKREKGIWQRRFWEHQIRDERDLQQHIDYVHYNPVKHGLVDRVQDWPYSSFHQYVQRGELPIDWAGGVSTLQFASPKSHA